MLIEEWEVNKCLCNASPLLPTTERSEGAFRSRRACWHYDCIAIMLKSLRLPIFCHGVIQSAASRPDMVEVEQSNDSVSKNSGRQVSRGQKVCIEHSKGITRSHVARRCGKEGKTDKDFLPEKKDVDTVMNVRASQSNAQGSQRELLISI